MNVDLCAMSQETGIDVTILAGVLGPRPVTSADEIEMMVDNAITLREMHQVYHRLPKGAPFKVRARKKLEELRTKAADEAVTIADWVEVARLSSFKTQVQVRALKKLDRLLEQGIADAAGDVGTLVALYKSFNFAGKMMTPFRHRVIYELAGFYTIQES